MKTVEVTEKAHRKEFTEFPKRLYRGDPCWVCPLDNEVEAVFDPARNMAFKRGEATRWLLLDDDNKTIGRVAAFIDEVRSKANRQPTGGFGFFVGLASSQTYRMAASRAGRRSRARGWALSGKS